MAPKVTKEDVVRVRKQLVGEGKNPTLINIRAALGDQGSNETLLKFKRELEKAELDAQDSPELLKSFRTTYQAAVQEGRAQQTDEIEELEQTIDALSLELDRHKSEAAASRVQVEDVSRKYEEIAARLNKAMTDLAEAREASEHYAAKLVESGEAHGQEIRKLSDRLEAEREAHDQALRLHREEPLKVSEEHRLEVDSLQQRLEKASELQREEIKGLRVDGEKANEEHRREIAELRQQLDQERIRANSLDVKLARAEARLEGYRDSLKSNTQADSAPIENIQA